MRQFLEFPSSQESQVDKVGSDLHFLHNQSIMVTCAPTVMGVHNKFLLSKEYLKFHFDGYKIFLWNISIHEITVHLNCGAVGNRVLILLSLSFQLAHRTMMHCLVVSLFKHYMWVCVCFMLPIKFSICLVFSWNYVIHFCDRSLAPIWQSLWITHNYSGLLWLFRRPATPESFKNLFS